MATLSLLSSYLFFLNFPTDPSLCTCSLSSLSLLQDAWQKRRHWRLPVRCIKVSRYLDAIERVVSFIHWSSKMFIYRKLSHKTLFVIIFGEPHECIAKEESRRNFHSPQDIQQRESLPHAPNWICLAGKIYWMALGGIYSSIPVSFIKLYAFAPFFRKASELLHWILDARLKRFLKLVLKHREDY